MKDALMTFKLYEYQKKILDQPDMSGIKSVFETIEMPLLPILEDMQRVGVNMNQQMLKELYDKYSAKLEIAQKQVYQELEPYKDAIHQYKIIHYNKKLDEPINISSPSQLSILFYEIIGYKTKSGKGTGVNELQEINSPLTKALLEYRKLEKIIDAFLISLPRNVSKFDGKIHTSLNPYRSSHAVKFAA